MHAIHSLVGRSRSASVTIPAEDVMAVTLPATYEPFLSGELEIPSWIVALLPSMIEAPRVADILELVESGPLGVQFDHVVAEPEVDSARWELEVTVPRAEGADSTSMRLWLQPSEPLEDAHLEWHGMTPEDVSAAHDSRWALGVGCVLGDRPLEEFHLQLKVLAAIAVDTVAILDMAACRPHPGAWLEEVVGTDIPPSPTNLYSIHAVHDDESSRAGTWMHTHGLLRCGCIELEMMDIPEDDATAMADLMNATAALLVEHDGPAPGEPFEVGAGFELVWLPWEDAIGRFSGHALGSRRDRDIAHTHPSGILFAPTPRRLFGLLPGSLGSPTRYTPALEENPLLYVSSMETERMGLLAHERLSTFTDLHREHGGSEDWLFLVKLGFEVDGASSDEDREHLWFQVHELEGDTVNATLLNEPYHIDRLHEGQRDTHSLKLLTDWAIMCGHGRFDPDTVVHLERVLASGDESAE